MGIDTQHYPQEYRERNVDFFYQNFLVNEHVLIPRYETESLVRHCISLCKKQGISHIVDIGTGSGVIPLSLANNLEYDFLGASDISTSALQVAKKNADRLGFGVQFFEGNLLDPVLDTLSTMGDQSVLITANLPYIARDEIQIMSPDAKYEPEIALFGGGDGFEIYRKLFDQINIHARIYLVIEFGWQQKKLAQTEFERRGWEGVFFSDERGIERFAEVRFR